MTLTKKELQKLRELRAHLTMERFGAGLNQRLVLDGQPVDPTAYITSQTRIWRESWILPVLDEIIARHSA